MEFKKGDLVKLDECVLKNVMFEVVEIVEHEILERNGEDVVPMMAKSVSIKMANTMYVNPKLVNKA